MSSGHVPTTDPLGGPGYEVSDASAKIVSRFGAVLLAMVFIAMGLMAGLFRVYAAMTANNPLPLPATPVPGPRLQVNTFTDYQALKAREEQQLGTYGWMSREDGVVRMPISEAMKLVAGGARASSAAAEGMTPEAQPSE